MTKGRNYDDFYFKKKYKYLFNKSVSMEGIFEEIISGDKIIDLDPKKAKEHYEKALESFGDMKNGDLLVRLAYVCIRLGKIERHRKVDYYLEALRYYENAIKYFEDQIIIVQKDIEELKRLDSF